MAKRVKKTRKELLKEPDEFITFSSKLIGLALEYKTHLTYALGIILALGIIFFGVRFLSMRAEKNASALLEKSLAKYEAVKDKQDDAEVYQDVSADFQFILKKYGDKKNGKLARLLYANICYSAGRYKEAIDLYQTCLKDFENHPMLQNQILSSLGYAHAKLEDFAAAVSYFEKITRAPEPLLRAEALYHLGLIYDTLGQTEKSREAFNKILSDHQDYIYIDLVKERLSG
jgi:tetratricopeptide (TPR) repeat protein